MPGIRLAHRRAWCARWRLRLGLEVLEGRALMAISALDPSFGRGGIVLGAPDSGSGTELSIPSAAAVQPDGKIVVAGTYAPTSLDEGIDQIDSLATPGLLAVRRYDADGSVDASFGDDGQADIPLGNPDYLVSKAPHDVVVAPDGSIFLAANLIAPDNIYDPINFTGASVVAKLTPTGQLDPTFATGGVFAADGAIAGGDAVALQPDGKIVAQGVAPVYGGTGMTVIRLTAAGQLDPTFNATGAGSVAPPAADQYADDSRVSGVALNAGGQVYALGGHGNPDATTYGADVGVLSRLQPDGTTDASFGVGGQ